MRRRKRKPIVSGPPFRLPDEVFETMKKVSDATGWKPAASLTFLLKAGCNAVGSKGEKIASFKQRMACRRCSSRSGRRCQEKARSHRNKTPRSPQGRGALVALSIPPSTRFHTERR